MGSTIEINDNTNIENALKNQEIEIITRIHNFPTYDQFFRNFLLKNQPCIFNAEVTKNWPCKKSWSKNNAPNFHNLIELFGECDVPIADCSKRYFNSQLKNQMTMKNYIEYWIHFKNNKYPQDMPLLYLKDWHCVKSYPFLPIYDVPNYFASDWLNEYYTAQQDLDDDYMFVYMGPKGTWTPLHVDVFTSYSWSANIVGKKKWLLFPPGQEEFMKNNNGDLIYDLNYKGFNNELLDNRISKSSIEVIQNAGEIIYIPSGWYHQVWNLEDTISINHNWFNGCNIWNVWRALKRELLAVINEISDCKDMPDWECHCQIMLKATFGIDYKQFYEILMFIAERRLDVVVNKVPVKSFNIWNFGIKHCYFDLNQIKIVLKDLIEDSHKKYIYKILWPENGPELLLKRIDADTNGCK